jgi:hypothetical protein
MKLQLNANLQLYPQGSNTKQIAIPISVKADGTTYNIPSGYKFFFDNDAELNNSIITGIRYDATNFISNNENYGGINDNFFTLTIKGKNDQLLVDSLPLFNLIDDTVSNNSLNPISRYTRIIRRFYLKPKWDKCYITLNTQTVINTPYYIYLTVFYKPNNTTNL